MMHDLFSGMISAQKEERLLKMNADTLVRIVCFV